ncbi:hypothetical protein BN14_02565 [Rhizoctonia solani AG-1 IB]|uniref:Uncharacterized protein n=1 Tax=Thanatephorus cucumeris (strain AG1-IB / isolate 7/3/14) TaxID=1108050 RepID=M5BQ72_THACB|nr:hypothetical protein BN14_02565 [Rhizoctonia solani AG-1 IB]
MSTAVFAKPIISEARNASSTLAAESFTLTSSATPSPAFTQVLSNFRSDPLHTTGTTLSSMHDPVETHVVSQAPSPLSTRVVSAELQPTASSIKSVNGGLSSDFAEPTSSSVALDAGRTRSAFDDIVNATSTLISNTPRPTLPAKIASVPYEAANHTSIASGNSIHSEPTLSTSVTSSLPTPDLSSSTA